MQLRNVTLAVGTAALLAVGCAGDTILRTETETENRIHVSGTAYVEVAPDMAVMTLGVQTFNADAVAAVTRNNERVEAIIHSLETLGVAATDMQTRDFSIYPQRVYNEGRADTISGFWVNNRLTVSVRDLTLVGTVLQGAIDAGANEIHGLQFTVANSDSVEDLAAHLAVEDARRRAVVLAEAAGARAGRIISLSESSVATPGIYRGSLDAATAVPVEPGQVEVTAWVSAVFALE